MNDIKRINTNGLVTITEIKDCLFDNNIFKVNRCDFLGFLFVSQKLTTSDDFEGLIKNNISRFCSGNLYDKNKETTGYANDDFSGKIKEIASRNPFVNPYKNLLSLIYAEYFEKPISDTNRFKKLDEHYDEYTERIANKIFEEHIKIQDKKAKITSIDKYIEKIYTKLNDILKNKQFYYEEFLKLIKDKLDNSEDIDDIEIKTCELSSILSYLTILAIFQNNIEIIFPSYSRTKILSNHFPLKPEKINKLNIYTSVPIETITFFNSALENDDISEICMAFHSGTGWLSETEKVDILNRVLCQDNIKLKIILNLSDSVNTICSHMSQPSRNYSRFYQNAQKWCEFASSHPKNDISIYFSTVPMLHRIYWIKTKSNAGRINVKYYTYGNFIPKNDHRISCDSTNEVYNKYEAEFNYLLENTSHKITHCEPYNDLHSYVYPHKWDDNLNISFIVDMLRNADISSINVLSILASFASTEPIRSLLVKRLTEDTKFSINLIVSDPSNAKQVKLWYPNIDEELFSMFGLFKTWCKKYPGKFNLHYTDFPITNRLYFSADDNSKEMFVNPLSIPADTNFSIPLLINKEINPLGYNTYKELFIDMWNNHSSPVELD